MVGFQQKVQSKGSSSILFSQSLHTFLCVYLEIPDFTGMDSLLTLDIPDCHAFANCDLQSLANLKFLCLPCLQTQFKAKNL